MRIVADFIFQHGTDADKRALNALRNHTELVTGSHCVYVYSLTESNILYPNETGSIIYIGEVCRANEPSGARFAGHISKTLTQGNNYTTNHTLTAYYYAKHRLRLQIYRLDTCDNAADRKLQERRLITAHVKQFGALPIGQGTTGPGYTPKTIYGLTFSSDERNTIARSASNYHPINS